MARTLHLTSPAMRGEDVRKIQALLRSRGYNPGATDGVYGPLTAAAAKRAKWRLGYAYSKVDGSAGDLLRAYLSGAKKRGPVMLSRARARMPAKRLRALALAKSQLGTKESPPGSNRVKYSAWYGITGPWCAMFVSWCFASVGSKSFVRGSRYAYVPYVLADARARRNGLSVVTSPIAGDLVIYNWEPGRNQVPDHIGIFEAWMNPSTFSAIEGNTAVDNNSNGGEVMRRSRPRSFVEAFVRVAE